MTDVREAFDAIRATDTGSGWMSTYVELAAHHPGNLPEHARSFDTVSAVKRYVESCGSRYFDADAVRFFRGRTDGQLFGRRFWVESRKFVDSTGDADPREYMVAWVTPVGASIEKLGSYRSLEQARRAARSLANAVEELDATHVNYYPHNPGSLYDCLGCEARCWCTGAEGESECVYEGVHYGTSQARAAFAAGEL
jgi:hypothetical protein